VPEEIRSRTDAKRQRIDEEDEKKQQNWVENNGMVDQMWNIHLKHTTDVHKEVETWKGIADSILIFVRLQYSSFPI
jgi:hypothetical protein